MKEVVFIIGAGASKEANLPTGNELKSLIADLLDIRFAPGRGRISGDERIEYALRTLSKTEPDCNRSIKSFLHEAWHIRDALPQAISIDNFIDSQRGNRLLAICGKLAIARAILAAERNSKLYIDTHQGEQSLDASRTTNTWYIPFFQILTENCTKEDLEERLKQISLVVFNYDRCMEHFLFHSLKSYYRLDDDESANLVNSIEIYHPYGMVGGLPWSEEPTKVSFGDEPHPDLLTSISHEIKTFTEGTQGDENLSRNVQECIHSSKKVVFLGFAYHKLNMELIKATNETQNRDISPSCFGSAFAVSRPDQEYIQNQINTLFHYQIPHIQLSNNTCYDFFNEYWRSLSF